MGDFYLETAINHTQHTLNPPEGWDATQAHLQMQKDIAEYQYYERSTGQGIYALEDADFSWQGIKEYVLFWGGLIALCSVITFIHSLFS